MNTWVKPALFSLVFICSGIFAQQATSENLKVGFVNIRQLIGQAPQLSQIQTSLAKEFESENQAIITLRREITQLSITYDKTTGEADLAKIQKQITAKQRKMIKLQQVLKNELNLRRNDALGKLQTLIVRMVAKVSKEKKLDIVLNNTGVIYVSARIDITPIVFKYLSEQKFD
ncbi:MAG: OmpH family outer membrane protein [Ostreibacterium sp.]